MFNELFRFHTIRPADPSQPHKTIRLSQQQPDVINDEKLVAYWIETLSKVTEQVRLDPASIESALKNAEGLDLHPVRAALHYQLSESRQDNHRSLADAVRGVEIALSHEHSNQDELKALSNAVLVSSTPAPTVRGDKKEKQTEPEGKKPENDEDRDVKVLPPSDELLQLANNTPSIPLATLINDVSEPTKLALKNVGLANTEGQSVGEAIRTLDNLKGSDVTRFLPTLHPPQPKPIGIAELEVVREHVLRYEPGDVAHIENILAGENKERVHRKLDRSEDVSVFDTETVRKESRDLESTERFEMAAETQNQIEEQSEWSVGTSVSASYGPSVEVGIEASAGGSTARSKATRQATSFSQEVTEKASSAITSKIREQRKRTLLTEIEETNTHGFSNTSPDKHIVGIYQWVDKIMQAQVFAYGKRLMYDLTLPEPGAFLAFIEREASATGPGTASPPKEWDLMPSMLTPDNWSDWAAQYDALEVPPAPTAVSKSLEHKIQPGESGSPSTLSSKISAPEGYAPVKAAIAVEVAEVVPRSKLDRFPRLVISVDGQDEVFDNLTGNHAVTPDEVRIFEARDRATREVELNRSTPGEVPVAIAGVGINAGAITVRVDLEPTEDRLRQWRYEAYASIRKAYESALSAYQAQLDQNEVNAGVDIEGRSPTENRRLERNELKKQAIQAFTRQLFNRFDAVEPDPEHDYPELDLWRYTDQGRYIKFFEQAFEWHQMTWVLYPYYWARKETWVDRLSHTGADAEHIEFLRAGAARVLIPVRPGFEASLLHYQSTGEVWEGDEAPQVYDEDYVPIIAELAEQLGRPSESEEAVGDPWTFKLPTDLVKVNEDGSLPRWKKNNEGQWVADTGEDE